MSSVSIEYSKINNHMKYIFLIKYLQINILKSITIVNIYF